MLDPPFDARTVVGAWARRLGALRDGLDLKPPSEFDSEEEDATLASGESEDFVEVSDRGPRD